MIYMFIYIHGVLQIYELRINSRIDYFANYNKAFFFFVPITDFQHKIISLG